MGSVFLSHKIMLNLKYICSPDNQCKCKKVFPPQTFLSFKQPIKWLNTQISKSQSQAQLRVLRSSANIYTILYRTPEYTDKHHACQTTQREGSTGCYSPV